MPLGEQHAQHTPGQGHRHIITWDETCSPHKTDPGEDKACCFQGQVGDMSRARNYMETIPNKTRPHRSREMDNDWVRGN